VLKHKGLKWKIFLFTLSVITLVIIVSFGILYFALPNYYLHQKSTALQRNAENLALDLRNSNSEIEIAELIANFAQSNNANVVAFDENNSLIPFLTLPFLFRDGSSLIDGHHYVTATIVEADAEEIFQRFNISTMRIRTIQPGDGFRVEGFWGYSPEQGRLLYRQQHELVTMTKVIQNDIIDHITLNATLQPIHEAQGVVLSLMPYILAVAFLIAFTAAYLFTKQLTKPILQISNAAAQMQQMEPDALSDLGTADELGQLSRNLDSLYTSLLSNIRRLTQEMKRVEKLEQSKTDFMRAASHELKTPIAALNGILEGMIDNVGVYKNREKYLQVSKEQVHKLSTLVSEILEACALTDTEATEVINLEEVDIGALLTEVLTPYKLIMDNKNLRLQRGDFSFVCITDRKLLFHTFSNLISNAVNYTENGNKINIHFRENSLSIENECDELNEDLEKLFEPFYTLSYSRDKVKSGTGLGLYIVKRNLELLNLPYQMTRTELGVKFSIDFEKAERS